MNIEYLLSRVNTPGNLSEFSRVLDRLGNPQHRFKCIHIAGTNGKGSVSMMLAQVLQCAGYKTGLFVSPHVQDITERISVQGENILPQYFEEALEIIRSIEEKPLNFFEILTAAAFLYFDCQGVEYAVLETGLGGRKDPTNVCDPVLSLIVSVGMDHQYLLGYTLEKIAYEKAGICKTGAPVLSGLLPTKAVEVIEQAAQEVGTSLLQVRAGEPFFDYAYDFVNGCTELHTLDGEEWMLHALGPKQTENACLVYHAARQLGIGEGAIRLAFETVHLPARFEIFSLPHQTVILDGAHNVPAIKQLMHFWPHTPFAGRAALVCGFMKDKDYAEMLELLYPHFKHIVLTCPPSERAADPDVLAAFVPKTQDFTVERVTDYRQAWAAVSAEPYVLCTGSFYLAGAVRQLLVQGKESSTLFRQEND